MIFMSLELSHILAFIVFKNAREVMRAGLVSHVMKIGEVGVAFAYSFFDTVTK